MLGHSSFNTLWNFFSVYLYVTQSVLLIFYVFMCIYIDVVVYMYGSFRQSMGYFVSQLNFE